MGEFESERENMQVDGHWLLSEASENTDRCLTGGCKPGITVIAHGGISSQKWTQLNTL